MTPPDSGERRQGKSHLHIGKECGPSCPLGNGIEFKPDSGEREGPHPFPCDDPNCRYLKRERRVVLPLPLAQRILAALEEDECVDPYCVSSKCKEVHALADELRASLPR